ncbi:MAG: HesA/MoeB/ThiF family protein [Desulfobacteraceae bacterium]|nr:HesA/MoeB/ThiF family protein [Desulfobacteraceae bacterium]
MAEQFVKEDRYIRNFKTLSHDEQNILEKATVSIIGLGGLGGTVTEMLARTGVGNLRLVDGDIFETSNLNRQLLSEEHLIGSPKADAAKKRVIAVNSSVHVDAHHKYADESNLFDIIKGSDLVVDCLDTIDSRFVLQKSASKAGIPVVSGAIAGVSGQVTVIFPEDQGFELIYGKKAIEQSRGVETQTGNISYCALFIAALQSSECLKVLLNRGDILRNKLLIADLWSNSFEVMDLI